MYVILPIISILIGAYMLYKRCYGVGLYVLVMFIQALILAKTGNNWSSVGTVMTILALLTTGKES